MIILKGRIYVSGNNGEVQSIVSNAPKNNVSSTVSEVLNKQLTTQTPFILGKSILGSGDYYVNELPYFMGGELSDGEGNFSSPYNITVNGNNLESMVILFDTVNDGHPITVIVDGVTIYDDDPRFEVPFDETLTTHTIQINNWNKPNSPLIITGIQADINIEIDENNLISYNGLILDRDYTEYPNYGIVSNNSNLIVADRDGAILDLITQGLLNDDSIVEIKINNDKVTVKDGVTLKQIRTLIYDNDNRQVNINLQDGIESWQERETAPKYYDFENPVSKSLRWLYEYLYTTTTTTTTTTNRLLPFEELDSDTQNVLSQTIIQYPILDSTNLWAEWVKLCEVAQLHIWVDKDGIIRVHYNSKD